MTEHVTVRTKGWFGDTVRTGRADPEFHPHVGRIVSTIVLTFAFCLTGVMWGCPTYRVWERTLAGQAELKQAEWNRQITIKEAQAKKEAAASLSAAEVERARGAAEANQIIGESLAGPGGEAYLRYLWIQGLHDGTSETIYIPTEANLPILEASRRGPVEAPK